MADAPEGATLHLGGAAYAHPSLEPLLVDAAILSPHPHNPRRGDQERITASIRDLGLYRAVIAQQSSRSVLAGNHTLRALLELGATRVPVTWVDVDDVTAEHLLVRDNRTSDLGTYDDEALLAILNDLSDAGVPPELLAYSDADLDVLRRRVEAEDVWGTGVGDMLDEFKDISGQMATDYNIEYAYRTIVYFRDMDAVAEFAGLLGLDTMPRTLNWPTDWKPRDRRRYKD